MVHDENDASKDDEIYAEANAKAKLLGQQRNEHCSDRPECAER
jgi:hypothetical protein